MKFSELTSYTMTVEKYHQKCCVTDYGITVDCGNCVTVCAKNCYKK